MSVEFNLSIISIKSRRWRAKLEEVDKGCSEFCITVGTATRTASILIHSQLKALAVNLSWPSADSGSMLVLLAESNNPRWLKVNLVVSVNPSSLWV